MTAQAEEKGKIELLLDEFGDVHGTVLLGMHKELQGLKDEVDARVEARIGRVLEQIEGAEATLQTRLAAADRLLSDVDDKLRQQSTAATALAIAAAKKDVADAILTAKESLASLCATTNEEISKRTDALNALERGLLDSIETQRREALSEIAAHRSEFQRLLVQIGNQRSSFDQEIAQAMGHITRVHEEQETRISAALKVADKLSSDTRTALRSVRKRNEALAEHELALQKRRRRGLITLVLAALAALALWLWKTFPH